ncbi:hypothetical protein HDZ31DRAFT_20865, partial [Schizophyllum fasciatum]
RHKFFLGDLIVVWRAWVLWPGSQVVHIILGACVVGMIGASVAELVIGIKAHRQGQSVSASILARILTTLLPVLVTSMIGTSLVAYRAWRYYKDVRIDHGSRFLPRVGQAMLLLIESGAIYIAFWVNMFVQNAEICIDAYRLRIPLKRKLQGIFPTSIILIVSTKRSFAD